MVLAVEKGLVFIKYYCFRELVSRYLSTFLIMLSPTMNTDVLDFSSGSGWITLSTCTSFTLILCLANFVNWRSLSDWMRFEVVDIQVSRRSSFISEMLSSFGLSHRLLPLHSQEFRLSSVLMTLFFSFTSSLKKSISLSSEEIWFWRLRRKSSRCYFSFVSLGSCCFTSCIIACFSCILAALS